MRGPGKQAPPPTPLPAPRLPPPPSPHTHRFELADARNVDALRALTPDGSSWDLVCVDLSGRAALGALLPALAAMLAALPRARFVVKNEALFCHLEAVASQQQQEEQHGRQGVLEGSAGKELAAALAAVLPHCERYTDTTYVAHALKYVPRKARTEAAGAGSALRDRQQQEHKQGRRRAQQLPAPVAQPLT